MTDIEIEKLAEAIARKLTPIISTDLQDRIEEILAEKLDFVMRRVLTKIGEAFGDVERDM
jgi:hypothetical protein